MKDIEILEWLLSGDPSVGYQVHRDLLGEDRPDLQARIASEGWGAQFLAAQRPDGHWGRGFYQPKWTSTHYSLLDLRLLELPPAHPAPARAIRQILAENISVDGGVSPTKSYSMGEVCVSGMFLDYACWFRTPEERLAPIVDFLVDIQMDDGGFNCEANRRGAVHSSLHTTISVLEGLLSYRRGGYGYRLAEIEAIMPVAEEFILQHRLFRSDKTGETINPRFLLLSFPHRWFYTTLRALDYFRAAGRSYDPRMAEALDILKQKQRKDGTWPLQGVLPGKVHFQMENPGQPSRWNTLRALRVLKAFDVAHATWHVFDDPAWPVRLRYPDPTPGGSRVRLDERRQESGHRVHFVSETPGEVYFEIGQSEDPDAARQTTEFKTWLKLPETGAQITDVRDVAVLGLPAVRIEAVWLEKRRWIHFLSLSEMTFRIILDPDSTINLDIFETLELKHDG